MASSSRAGFLRHGNDMVLMPKFCDRWILSKILLDNIFDKEPITDGETTERTNEDDDASLSQLLHQIVFADHSQGEGVKIILAPL